MNHRGLKHSFISLEIHKSHLFSIIYALFDLFQSLSFMTANIKFETVDLNYKTHLVLYYFF